MATATRTARKTPTKTSTRAKKAAPPAAADGKPKTAKPAATVSKDSAKAAVKTKKPKLVRDSFTIPKQELAVLEELKARAARLGHPAKKSEVLRAGVQALTAMADPAFLAIVSKLAPAGAAAKRAAKA